MYFPLSAYILISIEITLNWPINVKFPNMLISFISSLFSCQKLDMIGAVNKIIVVIGMHQYENKEFFVVNTASQQFQQFIVFLASTI